MPACAERGWQCVDVSKRVHPAIPADKVDSKSVMVASDIKMQRMNNTLHSIGMHFAKIAFYCGDSTRKTAAHDVDFRQHPDFCRSISG